MADLGAVGRIHIDIGAQDTGIGYSGGPIPARPPWYGPYYRGVVVTSDLSSPWSSMAPPLSDTRISEGGKDITEGNSQPSLKVRMKILRKGIFWPVTPGERTISIDVKMFVDSGAGRRPMLRVYPNPECGVWREYNQPAGSGTAWQTIGPLVIPVLISGVLEIGVETFDYLTSAVTWWDNLSTT